jgi:predicted outer membrane protein
MRLFECLTRNAGLDMKTTVIAGAAFLIATAAFAQSLGEKTGINSVLGIAPSTQDFVNEAAIGGLFEVESSKLAIQKTEGPLKDFATQLVADHTKAGEKLAGEAKAANFTVPSALDPATREAKHRQFFQGIRPPTSFPTETRCPCLNVMRKVETT